MSEAARPDSPPLALLASGEEMNEMDNVQSQLYRPEMSPVDSFNAASRLVAPPPTSSSDSDSSETDSDSDGGAKWKRSRQSSNLPTSGSPMMVTSSRHKAKPLPAPATRPGGGLPDKFKVWSNVLLEQTLVTDLNTVAVRHANISNDRESESYDYTAKYEQGDIRDAAPTHHLGNAGAAEIHRRLGLKRSAKERLGQLPVVDKAKRSFEVTENDPLEKVVTGIATILREPKTELIERVVRTLGKKKALEVLTMTEDIEDAGGLMTVDQSRRRTPGGVYLLLIRRDREVSQTEKDIIFEEDRKLMNEKKKELLKARRRRSARFENKPEVQEALEPLPTLPQLLLKELVTKDGAETKMECGAGDNDREDGEISDDSDKEQMTLEEAE